MPSSAFGLLGSSLLPPTISSLTEGTSTLLAAARDVLDAMARGTDAARAGFENIEAEAQSVMKGYEP